MPATFSIPPTLVTFGATIQGSRQEIGDLQRLTLGIHIEDETEWINMQTMVTSQYHVHAPLGGDLVIDIVRGPGIGYLIVDNLNEGGAILIDLQRSSYAPNAHTFGSATFLITAATF
jgi:hypothetical protein